MRARACVKCHEYIVVHPENPIYQSLEQKFNKQHTGHTIISVDLSEIKDTYNKFENHQDS
ncbi:MAG: hypothetical protein EU544_06470 [Promethearchaeota archaeon]|nr:MAG: hypothetical protein EU544_06470 [Candidatus Lokiarchaeota archaeon]